MNSGCAVGRSKGEILLKLEKKQELKIRPFRAGSQRSAPHESIKCHGDKKKKKI